MTRRIGEIIDELDLKGQNKELVDELVALSLKHGIMTPYTSFLADENLSLHDRSRLMTEAESRSERGLSVAGGSEGFLQRSYKSQLKAATRPGSDSLSGVAEEADRALDYGSSNPAGGGRPAGYSGAARRSPATGPAMLGGYPGGGGIASGVKPNDAKNDATDADESKSSAAQRVRHIGTKTFYWKNNEWQDSEFATLNEDAQMEVIEVQQFSDEYFELTQMNDARYSRYPTLTEPILIRLDGKNYRIVPIREK